MAEAAIQRADEDLLLKILAKEAQEAEEKVVNGEKNLSDPEVANPLILRLLTNHVESLRMEMREGFAKVDARFEQMQSNFDARFGQMQAAFDARSATVDERFERMGQQLEGLRVGIIDLHKQINRMTIFFVGGIGLIATVFKALDILVK